MQRREKPIKRRRKKKEWRIPDKTEQKQNVNQNDLLFNWCNNDDADGWLKAETAHIRPNGDIIAVSWPMITLTYVSTFILRKPLHNEWRWCRLDRTNW